MSYNISNPFEQGVYEALTVSKEDSANTVNKTNAELKNAVYKQSAREQFANTAFDSFVENIEAPTPQLNIVCGIGCTND